MFKGSLYPIQRPAAEFLCNKKRALLAFEQGTGKTVISIAALDKLFELGKIKNALIIGQAGNYWQWAEKFEEFTDISFTLAESKKKSTRTYKPGRSCPVVITNWNLFRNDFDSISNCKWDLVIADEAQEFRNYKSVTGRKIKRLNTLVRPRYRWALTGTAISNNLEDLYSILYWVDPSFLPAWPFFEKNHLLRNEFGVVYKYKNLTSLNKLLQQRVDRKTHADFAGQMPELVEQIHKVEPNKEITKTQDKLLGLLDNMAANLIFDEEGNLTGVKRDSKVSKEFLKLRKELISKEKLNYAIRLAEDILVENPANRVVIFSFFKEPLYGLGERIGPLSRFFTGDQTTDAKRDSIKAFGNGEARILLASNAGKAGLDLPFANYVIHLDIPFSHEVLDQRNKRITRANSIHTTAVVNYLIVNSSIEEYYYQIVKNKGRLASAVLEGTENEVIMRPSSLREFIRDDDAD